MNKLLKQIVIGNDTFFIIKSDDMENVWYWGISTDDAQKYPGTVTELINDTRYEYDGVSCSGFDSIKAAEDDILSTYKV